MPSNLKRLPRDELEKLYIEEKLSTSEIGEIYHVHHNTVKHWLDYYGIPTDPKRKRKTWREKVSRALIELWKDPQYKERMRKRGFQKGHVPWNKGKRHSISDEGIKKLREINQGRSPANRKVYLSKTELEQMYCDENMTLAEIAQRLGVTPQCVWLWLLRYGIERRLYPARPTTPEKKLLTIIKKYNLPYVYTGNDSFRIGALNPDFVNNNGQKIAVEVFGDYWHGRRDAPWYARENVRRLIMKNYGWDLRVVWEHELNNLPEEEIVRRLM
jgi:DNA-binding transcriptional regulator YiaG